MDGEREIGGLRCRDVLARLGDYLDGSLDPDGRAAVEAHVHACDNCARFGGVYARTVQALRGLRVSAPGR